MKVVTDNAVSVTTFHYRIVLAAEHRGQVDLKPMTDLCLE